MKAAVGILLAVYAVVTWAEERGLPQRRDSVGNVTSLVNNVDTLVVDSSSDISSSRTPTPCFHPDFQPPVYQFSNFSYKINITTYVDFADEVTISLAVRDTANNYSMVCTWRGRERDQVEHYWGYSKCVVDGDPSLDPFYNRFYILVPMTEEQEATRNVTARRDVIITQVWVCANGAEWYPYFYSSNASFPIEVACPLEGQPWEVYDCDLGDTAMSPTVEAIYYEPPPEHIYNPTNHTSGSPDLLKDDGSEEMCERRSLSYPGWEIDAFYYTKISSNDEVKGDETLNFTITNRATEIQQACIPTTEQSQDYWDHMSVFVECHGVGTESGNSSYDNTRFSLSDHTLHVEQSWSCGHERKSTVFKAQGTAPVPVFDSGEPGIYRGRATIIDAVLEQPISLNPEDPPLPENLETAGCTASSSIPKWQIRKLDYLETWFGNWAGTTDLRGRTLDIEITNLANNFTEICHFSLESLNGVRDNWLRCDVPHPHVYPVIEIESYLKFDLEKRYFYWKQTWYCDDLDGPAIRFTGAFNSTLDRTLCGWTNTTNDVQKCSYNNAFVGTITYDCQPHWNIHWCNGTGAGVFTGRLPDPSNGYLIEATELPDDNSLAEPEPTGYSCTLASIASPVVWNLTMFEAWLHQYSNLDPADLRMVLQVQLETSAYTAVQSGYPEWLDGEWVFNINGETVENRAYRNDGKYALSDSYPFPAVAFNYLGWKLYFNPILREIEIQTSWYCDDKDVEHPLVFSASYHGTLDLTCIRNNYSWTDLSDDERYHDNILCTFPTTSLILEPNVTWATSATPLGNFGDGGT